MVYAQVGKDSPDTGQNERSIEFIKAGDTVRTAGWLKEQLTPFMDSSQFLSSQDKIPAGRVALGD